MNANFICLIIYKSARGKVGDNFQEKNFVGVFRCHFREKRQNKQLCLAYVIQLRLHPQLATTSGGDRRLLNPLLRCLMIARHRQSRPLVLPRSVERSSSQASCCVDETSQRLLSAAPSPRLEPA